MLSTRTIKNLQSAQRILYEKNSPTFLQTDKFT